MQCEGTVGRMDIDGISTLLTGVSDESLSRFFVACIIGVLTNRHAEDLTELCPVSDVSAFVEDIRHDCRHDAQASRFITYDKGVAECFDRRSVCVRLVAEYKLTNGVVVLASDGVEVDNSVCIEVELKKREAPEFRLYDLFSEPSEPWLFQKVVNGVVGLFVADEFYRRAACTYKPLSVDTDEVRVSHEG